MGSRLKASGVLQMLQAGRLQPSGQHAPVLLDAKFGVLGAVRLSDSDPPEKSLV